MIANKVDVTTFQADPKPMRSFTVHTGNQDEGVLGKP